MPHNLSEPEADRQLEEGAEPETECVVCGMPGIDGECVDCQKARAIAEENAAEEEHARQEMLRDLAEGR